MATTPFAAFTAAYLALLLKEDPNGFGKFVRTIGPYNMQPTYDFIIVGAGAAGSVVASRLSENPNWNILALEAGEQENHFSRTTLIADALLESPKNWNYTSTRQKRVCQASQGRCDHPRGRSLGGSGAINLVHHLRGYRSDYDRWGEDNPQWDFNHVHPYFLKSENYMMIPQLTNYGKRGPIPVTYPTWITSSRDSLLQAALDIGLKEAECQDYEHSCIQKAHSGVLHGRRWSSSTGYLESQSYERDNLHVITSARVTKILFDNERTASGVWFQHNGRSFEIKADKEVILCAGSIDSPKLLMLSGIGPRDHLEQMGIHVRIDLPVGNNLQDHMPGTLEYQLNEGAISVREMEEGVDEYIKNQTGPLSSTGVEIWGANAVGRPGPPIIRYLFEPVSKNYEYIISAIATITRPFSRGTVRLSSPYFEDDPLIDFNFLSVPEEYDLLVRGMLELHEMFLGEALKSFEPKLKRIPECADKTSIHDYIPCTIKYNTLTSYHSVSTVKMSPKNKGGVVNQKLEVYKTKKLRVVDASIAPYDISVSTWQMAIMIGEKGSCAIKKNTLNVLTHATLAGINFSNKIGFIIAVPIHRIHLNNKQDQQDLMCNKSVTTIRRG